MTVYSSAKYERSVITKEVYAISVSIDGVNSLVPLDPANTDYQNIMALVDEGKLVIQPAEDPTK
jgi:hypothetical protein